MPERGRPWDHQHVHCVMRVRGLRIYELLRHQNVKHAMQGHGLQFQDLQTHYCVLVATQEHGLLRLQRLRCHNVRLAMQALGPMPALRVVILVIVVLGHHS